MHHRSSTRLISIATWAVAALLIASLVAALPALFSESGTDSSASIESHSGSPLLRLASDPTANVTVAPTSDPVGSQVTLSGGGFAPDVSLMVFLNGTAGSTPLPPCGSNATGNFSCGETIPYVPGGPYQFNVTDPVDNGTANFTVTPAVSISPAAGYVGSLATLNGTGFVADGTVSITFHGNAISGCNAGSNQTNNTGAFSCKFTIPALVAGSYSVVANDSVNQNSTIFTILAPSTTLVPSAGLVASTTDITGIGFSAGKTIVLTFGSDRISTCSAGTLVVNSSGGLNCSFEVPALPHGSYPVVANDSINAAPAQTFQIGPPVLDLTVTAGWVGNRTTAEGFGFAPNSHVMLTFASTTITSCVSGSRLTDASGDFSCEFVVPASPNGAQNVDADDTINTADATFTVKQNLVLSESTGDYGDSVTVTGTGYPASVPAAVTWNSTFTLCTHLSGANGSFSCSFTVPTAANGAHSVRGAAGGVFTSRPFQVVPVLFLSRSSVQVDNLVTASGYGFNATGSIAVRWDESATLCSSMPPDVNGALNCTFDVPATPGGEHNVTYDQSLSSLHAAAAANVSASMTATPDFGADGSTVGLSGTGFGNGTPYRTCLEKNLVACPVGGPTITSLENGSLPSTATFTVPLTTPGGAYFLIASWGGVIATDTSFTVTTASVVATPDTATVGSYVNLTGSGYAASTGFTYCIQPTSSICPAGTPTGFTSTPTGDIPSGVPGIPVPPGPAGTYYLDVSYSVQALIAATTLQLISNLTSNLFRAPVGAAITLTGTGFEATEGFTVSMETNLDANVTLCTGTTDSDGGFACRATTPPASWGPEPVTATVGEGMPASFLLTVLATLSTNDAMGTVGTSLQASASGFNATTAYSIVWGSGPTVCSGTSNATGNFGCDFVVPASPAGAHTLRANAGLSTNSTEFSVVPFASASPVGGPIGSTAQVAGNGFGASDAYSVVWNGTLPVCSGTTDAVGNLTCQFSVPNSPGGSIPILIQQGLNSASTAYSVMPALIVSPPSGTVGSRASSTASGLIPGSAYSLDWNSSLPLCSGSAPASGTYVCTFTVPDVPGGYYNLTATSTGTSYPVEFQVLPAVGSKSLVGPVGSSVGVTGDGFAANTAFSVSWNSSVTLCTGTSNVSGGLSCSFLVPTSPGGDHLYNVTQGATTVQQSFRVTSSIAVSPASATVGSTVTVTGTGFAAFSAYKVLWNDTQVLCSGSTNVNGAFACAFLVPSVGAGSYTITGVQGTSTPAVTISVTGGSTGSSPAPFPWWYIVIIVLVIVAALGAVLLLRRRRPSRSREPPKPWDESGPEAKTDFSATSPVPLHGVPPSTTVAAGSAGVAAAIPLEEAEAADAQTPPEDVDALIDRLERIADQVYKRKPSEEAGTSEDAAK